MSGAVNSRIYRLVCDWTSDSGAKVELLESGGRHWTRRRDGNSVVMLPVSRLLARDHREYASRCGHVYGKLVERGAG